MNRRFRCCDDQRHAAVSRHGALNGIDWLEVVDLDAPVEADRQRFLRIAFIKPPGALAILPANVRIGGGERIPDVEVVGTAFDGDVLVVEVRSPGDHSTYTLRLVDSANFDLPLPGFDPLLAAIGFSFKVECDSRFDCETPTSCPPETGVTPEIDYLARDYPALRQLLLDRLSVLLPGWTNRPAADVGVTLVELLAFVGDRLSYEQDAVATEAYLGTARRRSSVKRHVRLIDYRMHDGSNARTWVHFSVGANAVALAKGTRLLTAVPHQPGRLPPTALPDLLASESRPLVFEAMHDALLFTEQNEMRFYTWGGSRCCLPRRATRATLATHVNSLSLVQPDRQVLIFEEVAGPTSGNEMDRDLRHRHAVRLTRVTFTQDPLGGQLHPDPAQRSDAPVPVTEIEWHPDDALPFALCISAVADGTLRDNLSVARGNIVLADHGLTRPPVSLKDKVPAALFAPSAHTGDPCATRERTAIAPRYRPEVSETPLTMAAPYSHETPPPASRTLESDPRVALASITLRNVPDPNSLLPTWRPAADLLAAGPTDERFVVDVEQDGSTTLRFGDGVRGRRPPAGAEFVATCRVGSGSNGNIGADAIRHVLSLDSGIIGARNPQPAAGGTDQESAERVRALAPASFRTQERAVTPDDYARVARTTPRIQNARATPRWTGSWRSMFVTVDHEGIGAIPTEVRESVRGRLDRYRMAGHDVAVRPARYVPLEIHATVCVEQGYFASDVERALLARLGSAVLPDGTRGLFHPDNFTFGQPVWLSQVYGAARSVPGVGSVVVTRFGRQQSTDTASLTSGEIRLHRLELPQLLNDPNFPERGLLKFTMQGGM